MRAFLLTSLTMVAFASNSILNRAAVDAGHADPAAFALVRVLAGVVVLCIILTLRGGKLDVRNPKRWGGAVALSVYMIGFSLAYVSLDAGVGALILFGTVQIALFAHSAWTGEPPNRGQNIGAAIAFAGLLLALWPDQDPVGSMSGAFFMLAGGLGWAAYTLAGRGAKDPIGVTASHFLLSLPMLAVLLLVPDLDMSATGWALAILAGGITSGLGYALWYSVLPSLPGARAAIVQLSVPVLAILMGAALLGEPVSFKVIVSAGLVLGGIGMALRAG
ncbi:MAG: DMT family transporter [Aliishimia sp.]